MHDTSAAWWTLRGSLVDPTPWLIKCKAHVPFSGVAPVCFLFYLLLPLPNRANFQMIVASDQLRVHTHFSAPYETFPSKEGHVELLVEIPS